MTETTRDLFFGGRMLIEQPKSRDSYRVNIDSLLLAGFAAAGKHAQRAFDLGAGVGAVGLSLMQLNAASHITFIDVSQEATSLASRNAEHNGWADRSRVLTGDVQELALEHKGEADLIVTNPPFSQPRTSVIPRSERLTQARIGDLSAFLAAARQLGGKGSRSCYVYPAQYLSVLLGYAREQGLEPKRVRFVHSRAHTYARLALVECKAGKPGGLVVEPPLVEWNGETRSEEVRLLIEEARLVRRADDRA